MKRKLIGLCLLILVFLLAACGKQAAEGFFERDAATQTTQSTVKATEPTEDDILNPPVTQPQGTVKPSDGDTQSTEPTEGTKPTDETKPPETTQPPEVTEPTEPPLWPGLGDNELPLVPVG